jgi:hypothetical protein
MPSARGTFEVKLAPLDPPDEAGDGNQLGRMSIDKTIVGDLEATTRGQMLSAMSATRGSAGYVAIERVTGALHGRRGSFVLQHSGTMDRGVPTLAIHVVPDSGTGELKGLSGTFELTIAGGVHSYVLDYSLAEGD